MQGYSVVPWLTEFADALAGFTPKFSAVEFCTIQSYNRFMVRGRPRTFEFDAAMDRAVEAFWRHGYEACSLNILLEQMALSRSSFYQAFGDKNELFRAALTRYCQQQAAQLERQLAQSDSAWTFLHTSLVSIADSPGEQPAGCLLVNSATELGAVSEPFRDAIEAGLARFREVFGKALKQAKSEGSITPQADIGVLTDLLLAYVCGLRTLSKAGIEADRLRAIAMATLDTLHAGATNRVEPH